MSGFQALSLIWLSALFIPLIIFYFLKLKRPRTKIPSLVLWQQVLNDRRVNSPFQRFKKHLLLFLQLLILAFIILAALQPFYMGQSRSAKRLPILIDNSASMGALGTESSKSCLDDVKEKVRTLINNKLNDQQFCIISFSDTARKRCGFTDNKRILLDALENIDVEDVASDLEDALRMTQAMARNFNFNEVLMFSDGNIPEKTSFDLPFNLDFRKMKPAGANIGITDFGAARAGESSWRVFVQVESTQDAGPGTIKLFADGKLIGEEQYIPGEEEREQRLLFQVDGSREMALKAILEPKNFDSLASDNSAYLFLPVVRPLKIFVSLDLHASRAALKTMKNVEIFPKKEDLTLRPVSYDLIITDKQSDIEESAPVVCFIGILDALKKYIETKPNEGRVVDWERSDPLLEYVQLNELVLIEEPQYIKGVDGRNQVGNLGFKTLVYGQNGPLLLKRRYAGQVMYDLLFYPQKSTLPYRIAFPILLTNLVNLARYEAGLADIEATKTGVLPAIQLQKNSNYDIKTPAGKVNSEKTDKHGVLDGISARYSGIYEISDNNEFKTKLGVSLMSAEETSLATIDKLQFNELSVDAVQKKIKAAYNLWPLLTLIAFCFLIFEWWFFNKPVKRFGKKR